MKIWIDILTPKQLLFAEPLIGKLSKNNTIICTSRNYYEVKKLAKIRDMNLIFVGKHGGVTREGKLIASIERMRGLYQIVTEKKPDLLISFCSPEASRIAFGLGIKHIAFQDSPHAIAVMKLCLPFVSKLFTPWIIPKKEYVRFGIDEKNIIHYRAIDAAITIKRDVSDKIKLPFANHKKNVILRLEEEQAAYTNKNSKSIEIAKRILDKCSNENLIILARYDSQIKKFKKSLGKNVNIIKMSFDGKVLLNNTNVFIGSGGTMTAESALLGIPTISYSAVPNIVEDYLVKKKIIIKTDNPTKIAEITKDLLENPYTVRKKSQNILRYMEDPYNKLVKTMKRL